MLGDGPTGLSDGMQNPIKKSALKLALYGFLAMAVAAGAGLTSWYVAPECPTIPQNCKDEFSYLCNDPSVMTCSSDASSCMQTCGCCTDSPKSWCPNKVKTLQSVWQDNQLTVEVFIGVFALITILQYWRLCCAERSAEKTKMIVLISVCNFFTISLMACGYLVYMVTDCQNKFRGISDVLLFVSSVALLMAMGFILFTGVMVPQVAKYGALLSNMAGHRSRMDYNILVLQVSADRTRSFITEEEQRGVELTVHTNYGFAATCMRCFRIWYFLLLAAIFGVCIYIGGLKVFVDSRFFCFMVGYLVWCLVFVAYRRIKITQSYLDHHKRQQMQKWRQELEGSQQLLLFQNLSQASGTEGKSVIAFGKQRVFFFAPSAAAAAATPGAFVRTTHTRVLGAEGQHGAVLELKTVVHRRNPGMLRADVRAENVVRIPLEAHQVEQVREWLGQRRDLFEFETGPEVELLNA